MAGGRVRLKLVLYGQVCAELQVFNIRSVLLTRIIQLTALTERLEVHRQHCRLNMHRLIVRDGALHREEEDALNTNPERKN